ncbi:hypothetical protein [Pedobacter miscanthi]|uniref:Uncharacterized protein n=1 Tax=Pedobacter miscanthi TaxID=2259170 RepID=A0A366KYQ5_9SPHI|nr:hypothetical protein [Pedobacter miscanthi]RBQ06718.1 hypothetical protein DRW42_13115 [Pedobacter miscanthi]
MSFIKKGGAFEQLAKDFLERILSELGYEIVRSRTQYSGTQDGYDNLLEVVDGDRVSRRIYVECKDYSSKLIFADAVEKIPHIVSTHDQIDLLLFISPFVDFANTNEETKLEGFFQAIASKCPVDFLTPNAYIKEYFALYPDLYRVVYKSDVQAVEGEERAKWLRKFEKLIFSDKRLKKVVIREGDRGKYIGQLKKNNFHIDRTVRRQFEHSPFYWEEIEQAMRIEAALSSSKWGVVMLGNPGYGKTNELEQLAVRLWEDEVARAWMPKYEHLRDFHSATLIEELLPPDFEHLNPLLLILDGIDEVHDITDFTNKLRRFSSTHENLLDAGSLKILISCRTNIYLRYIKSIQGLDTVFLNGVTEGGAIRFLYQKYDIDPRKKKKFDYWRYRDILENPFYLELIGQSFVREKKVDLSRAKLIEDYLERRLKEDFTEKHRNDLTFSSEEQLGIATRIAVAMEAMQRSELKENEIWSLSNSGNIFFKNPFLEQNPSGTWSFEHKNIQEYLTARFLSKLSFEEIIAFIAIGENFEQVHPSWHNVISFLLNIEFDKEVYAALVQWLSENDAELLFEAKAALIPEPSRNMAFQAFFQDRVLENKLWIDDLTPMAEFGDTNANVEYLIAVLRDRELNLRSRISASSLLKEMAKSKAYHLQIGEVVLQVVDEFKRDQVLVNLLENVLGLMLELPEPFLASLFTTVIAELAGFDQREVVRPLLNGINGENLHLYLAYVLEILSKAIKEKPWNYSSKTGTLISTKEKIFDIFCLVKDPLLLLKVFSFLIERFNNYELKEKLFVSFLEHAGPIFAANVALIGNELVDVLTLAAGRDRIRYMQEGPLIAMIKACKLELQLYQRMVASAINYPPLAYFLAAMPHAEGFDCIVDGYKRGLLNQEFINRYRNLISHQHVDLAIRFESLMETQTSHRFEDHIDKEKNQELRLWHQNREQRELDLRFDLPELLLQMQRIYELAGVTRLSKQRMEKFTDRYYREHDLEREINPYSKQLLRELIANEYKGRKMLAVADLKQALLANELNRMEDISQVLPAKEGSRKVARPEQRATVLEWCLANQSCAFDYYQGNFADHDGSAALTGKLIFKFQRYFKFVELDQRLLLEMIWEGMDHEKINLDYMEGVVSSEEIHQYFLVLLEGQTLNLRGRFMLLQYFRENGLSSTNYEPGLKEEVITALNQQSDYLPKQVIREFFAADEEYLKRLLEIFGFDTRHQYFLSFLLGLLTETAGEEYVSLFISDHYEQLAKLGLMSEKEMIQMLIKNNSPLAFKKLSLMMQQPYNGEAVISGYNSSWKNFSNKDAVDDILNIIEAGQHGMVSPGLFDRKTSSFMRMATETLLSIANAHDAASCTAIMGSFTARNFSMDLDDDVFYLNNFKKDMQECFCKHISRPFSLAQAALMLDKYRFDLI